MAVAENAGVRNGTTGQNFDNTVVSPKAKDLERSSSKPRNEPVVVNNTKDSNFQGQNYDHQSINGKSGETGGLSNGKTNGTQMQNGFDMNQCGGYGDDQIHHQSAKSNGVRDMNDLVEMLSKLNPMAEEVHRLRLLGDYHHSTRIAFVEFAVAESAIAALNCSGAILGSLPIRVSPSKTPVRPRIPRPPFN